MKQNLHQTINYNKLSDIPIGNKGYTDCPITFLPCDNPNYILDQFETIVHLVCNIRELAGFQPRFERIVPSKKASRDLPAF